MTRPARTGRSRLLLVMLATAALFAGACSDSDEDAVGDDPVVEDDGTTEDATSGDDVSAQAEELAAEGEASGPWGVGVRTVEVTGARGRTLPLEVWYPIDAGSAGTAEPATYDFPGLEVPSESAVAGVAPAQGEFPLVVYSHGNGGLRYVSAFLTEHLASHGFVVVAPDHTGNTAIDSFTGSSVDRDQVALDRPADVSAVIDAATSGAAGLDDIAPILDADNVGVIGHSFGGYTALALAGGVGEIEADDRVDAVVGLAAATQSLDDSTLSAVSVPTLLLSGTMDVTTPPAEHTERAWGLAEGRPLVRADIADAGHQSFTDVCSYAEIAESRPDLPEVLVDAVVEYAEEGCAEDLIDIDEAHRVTRKLTTAFLMQQLRSEDRWQVLLDPETGSDPALESLQRRD